MFAPIQQTRHWHAAIRDNEDWQILEDRELNTASQKENVDQYIWSPRHVDSPIVCLHDGDGGGVGDNQADGDVGEGYPGDWRRYYLTDANHNVTTSIRHDNSNDPANDGVTRYVYTPYGDVTETGDNWTGNSAEVNFDGPRYAGYFFDTETGLYQVRNRYYDPNLSNFISRDPIAYDAGDPNLYRYVGNGPLGATDPMGLSTFIPPMSREGQYITFTDWFKIGQAAVHNAIDSFGFVLEGTQYGHPAKIGAPMRVPPREQLDAARLPADKAHRFVADVTGIPHESRDMQDAKTFLDIGSIVIGTFSGGMGFATSLGAGARTIRLGGQTIESADDFLAAVRRAAQGPRRSSGGSPWIIRPEGTRLKRVGNYWIKEVDPDASAIQQWWGRGSLNAQAKALGRLDDMAPSHLFKNGKLVMRDAGEYVPGNFWGTWARGSWRLRTPMNDIRPRNIGGPNNLIFDPALHPVHRATYWGLGGTTITVGGYGAYTVYDAWSEVDGR